MAEHFSFDVLKRSRITRARLGMIRTRQGYIETPQFIPVATVASVRALGSDDLRALGVQAIFANTYHLHLRTGEDLIRRERIL